MNAKLGPDDSTLCRLCRQRHPLKQSHILPAFIFRDLRNQSGTGHIRFSENPNVRVQDGLKLPWLCGSCESLLSGWERRFANEILHPWNNGCELTRYSDWFLKFCVSVSWRVLVYAKGINPQNVYSEGHEKLFRSAELTWREFLLDQRPHPGQFEQHFLAWSVATSSDVPDLPVNFNRFMMGAVTMDIVGSDRASYVWSKLGRFQIFGTISHGPNKWEGTKVHVRDGVLRPGKVVLPAALLDLYREKAISVQGVYQSISAAQLEKIDAAALSNIERFLDSRTFSAMQADAHMFGDHVVIRQSQDESS